MKKAYETINGKYYIGKCEELLKRKRIKGKVQLIITSPPFPLNKKKKYGNLQGEEYILWLSSLAELFSEVLTDDGSIVVEIGNAWENGRPVQSLLTIKALMSFVENEKAGLRLCQEFVCYNPARIPSPAQWVTVNRYRAVDSFTHIWWMSKTDFPKADNRKILRPYSKNMKKLLKRGTYNSGKRPSEHKVSEKGFLKNNDGSISHNVLELDPFDEEEIRYPYSMLKISNTRSKDYYLSKCKEKGIEPHPARMPLELASFFIEFLTDEDDLVLDPFGGSNTTGFVAERLGRKWLVSDISSEYAEQSKLRFEEFEEN